MRKDWLKIGLALIAVVLLAAFAAHTAKAEWHTELYDHIDKDQRIPALRWPWWTVMGERRWHWNPRPPHFRAQPNYTDYCWGIQDFIYNTRETPDAEIQMSLWCARTNRSNVNEPRWPEDDNHERNQNAWVWWGPFDLRRAEAGAIAFWYYLDYGDGGFTRDSLTVVVVDDDGLMTLNGDDFRENCPWGVILKENTQDWRYRQVWFDSLYLGDDTISFLGERDLWFAFVWQSDNTQPNGMGAFVDDVKLLWDDGLFEIVPDEQFSAFFGYPVAEDSIEWVVQEPEDGDEVYLRLDWVIRGSVGEAAFNINCYIDDQLFYTERREMDVDPDVDTTYTTITDTLWTVPADSHLVRWVLDVDDEVEESDEDNNVLDIWVSNLYNPPPDFAILTPEEDSTEVALNQEYTIYYSLDDAFADDYRFQVFFYWTKDISGWEENPEIMFEPDSGYHYMIHTFQAGRGENELTWSPQPSFDAGELDTNDVIYIVGYANDYEIGNNSYARAPGSLWIRPPLSVGAPDAATPVQFGLERVYPNPFNNSVNLEFTLARNGVVKLAAYDLAGRQVGVLADGVLAAGRHQVSWKPGALPGGVYMMRLEAGGHTFMRKAVYMP